MTKVAPHRYPSCEKKCETGITIKTEGEISLFVITNSPFVGIYSDHKPLLFLDETWFQPSLAVN